MKHRNLRGKIQAVLLFAGFCHTAWAANVSVNIIDFAFVPQSVTVNVNDTVTWDWVSDAHSSTADDGLWDSGVFDTGYVYSYTFTSTGDYPYYCIVHGFTGDVSVQPPANPPTVTLTNPPANATFSAPANIQLAAATVDTNAAVASVQFYEGSNLLETQTNSPYSFVVSNLAAGPYTFSAVATDTNGLSGTNSVSIQVVTPIPMSISAPLLTPGSFQFSYGASPGLTYVVQRAVTLPNWIPIDTNLAASESVLFQDASAPSNAAYYRVQLMPNP
ncbi:MAG TPA: Ig-like domain-containing protein [Verrucomicrobiae bacterium]|jgi:plastocyanin|nr:Ig-like domain-containing protein [Verrucomicrobiae bacterium]